MLNDGSHLATLVAAQLAKYPRHETFLRRRFENINEAETEACERLAGEILQLADGDLETFVDGYEFICEIQKAEELYFRRNKSYRLKTFQEALDEVYSNGPYMEAYMRGLLVTQVFWSNHCKSIEFYTNTFLAGLPAGSKLLEIGPGHGLLLARAVQALGEGAVTGWDVSESSLSHTASALKALGVDRGYTLEARNLFDKSDMTFDAVVFSEVLEHIEEPAEALASIRSLIRPGGRLFLNVPINSPAPDHLFLLRSPEETFELLTAQKYRILESGCFPATNYSIEQARKHDLTISVCAIATPC